MAASTSVRRAAQWRLAALGAAVFAAGCAIYAAERDPARVWLLPAGWSLPSLRGLLPDWLRDHLPSFAHAFAFSLLTAACLARRRASIALACGGWFAVDALAEAGQHPALAGYAAAALRGRFDWGDLAAAALGAALAALALLRSWHDAAGPPCRQPTR